MRERLPIALVLILAAVILTSCRAMDAAPNPLAVTTTLAPPEQPPVETPVISKPLIVPGIPGLYLAWGSPVNAVPPTREPADPLAPGNEILGVDCISYLGSGGDVGAKGAWDRRNSIDWSSYDTCLQQAASRKVKLPNGTPISQPVILTLPSAFSDTGSRYYSTGGHGAPGTSGNPFMRLHLPVWMQNDTYRFTFTAPSGQVYQSIRYGGEFKQRMIEFITAAGKRYNSNPQVGAVRIYVGVQGESQPVLPCQPYWDVTPPTGPDNPQCSGDTYEALLVEHEKTVSCRDYTAFVRDLSEAALTAFPDKAVLAMADSTPCAGMNGKAFRQWLYEGQWATKPIGLSMNNINVDRPDVDERPENKLAFWNKWTLGRNLRDLGYPMLYEFDAHIPSVEGMYWTLLSAAGNGGNFVLYHSPWAGTFSAPMWDVVDYWLASERRAWLVLRDREYPTYDFDTGYGTSGDIGDWGKYLRVLNPEDAPQACSPTLAKNARAANATAAAGGALNLTPACPEILPTPAITPAATPSPGPDLTNRLFDRQARRLDPRKVLRIAVSGDWPAFGMALPADITVSYLDAGKDSFDVVLPGASGRPARHTVLKTGSGLWKQATWTEDIVTGNLLDGDTFVQIINDAQGSEYLHEIYVSVPDGPYIPTPTPTLPPTATMTPTTTRTATATATSTHTLTATQTATHTPTATSSPAPSPTQTAMPTATVTATRTRTATSTSTATAVPTATPTATATELPTSTSTPVVPEACPLRPLGALPVDGPRGLAAGPDGFYAALFELSWAAGINGDSRTVAWTRASGPGRTNGLAVLGDTLVATNRDQGTVTLHDARTGERLAIIPTGSLPWGVTAARGAGGQQTAYVANFGSNSVSLIDLTSRQSLATVAVDPMPVSAVFAEGQVYVLHLDGALTVLDQSGKIVGQYKSGLSDTRGISFDPVRRRLYVGSQSGAIAALSLPGVTPVQRYVLPGPAYAVAVNPGTGRIFTVDAQSDQLYVVEPDSGEVIQLALPPQGDEEGGQGLAVWGNRVAVSNLPANSISFFDDNTCPARLTATPAPEVTTGPSVTPTRTPFSTATPAATPTVSRTPTRTPTLVNSPTQTRTATPTQTRTATPTPLATRTPSWSSTPTPSPVTVRAKVEIVWPHGGASVEDADLANVTAYLLAGDGQQGARTLLDSVPCDWEPVVRLWGALNNEPARFLGIGKKRMVTGNGRNYPAWDFNDVDVRQARDPANKLAFFVTVDSTSSTVQNLHNVWTHAADARTLFPQQDVPTSVTRARPQSVDAKIQIVWPQDNLPVSEAQRANITAYVFVAGTHVALAPEIGTSGGWTPTVRLHTSLNNEPEAAPGAGIPGTPRVVMGANGVKFLAWDFNDIDVSAANDPLNRLYFWLAVDGITTYSNVWAHAADARTVFPQPDVLNSCR